MARRLRQTMADYVVIAISPALIMTLVGSLIFFLIAVFYQGEYPARLNWVMACFVFAAVLIARISIEEGMERAMPFGAALAFAVGLAANKFIELRGDWIGQFGWILNWALIALAWWCAHKLTWDCTMIDDEQDASGEGLMQVAGLERPADERNKVDSDPGRALEGTTAREVPAGWWQRYVERQRRPHAPGVWVVYFSLAALPLFGIGQWFIPAGDTGVRRYAFGLLTLYVASGMGLLLTTSFLGLRRYLRQRRVEMPTLMANSWLAIGAAIVVVLLVVAALLPRPSAEFAAARLPFSVGSPDRRSSRYAPVPREGVKDEQPGQAPSREPEDQSDDANAQGGSQPGGESGQQGQGGTSSQKGQSSQGQSSGKGQSSQGAKSSQGGQSQPKGQSSNSSQAKQSPEESVRERIDRFRRERAGQSEQPPPEKPAQDQSGEQAAQQANDPSEAKSDQPPPDEQANNQQSDNPSENSQQRGESQAESSEQQASSQDQKPKDDAEQQSKSDPQSDDSNQRDGGGGRTPEAPSSVRVPEVAQAPLGFLAQVLRWAFYAAFALAVLYFLWRFRAEVWASIRDFLRGLRDFWDGLWGRRRTPGVAVDEEVAVKVPPAPFSTYADPFATGVAGRYSIEELIRYSFEAFEAWSREHGCPREPEQTPHELARDVGKLNAPMAADARRMAELYARAAYAEGEIPATARQQLEQLWQAMRQSSGARS